MRLFKLAFWLLLVAQSHTILASHNIDIQQDIPTVVMRFSYNEEFRLFGLAGLSLPSAIGNGEVVDCVPPTSNTTCVSFGDFANLRMESTWDEDGEGGYCSRIEWTSNQARRLEDCYEIDETTNYLYGGAEIYNQYWPINQHKYEERPYLSCDFLTGLEFGNLIENYWLLSSGVAIHVDEENPLFISYNTTRPNELCFISADQYPYNRRQELSLKYTICIDENVKTAHQKTFQKFYQKPSALPDETMLLYPLWSTWAQHRQNVNQTVMLDLARNVIAYNFTSSHVEIDDRWETCYGQEEFDSVKFPDPKAMVDEIKSLGLRITLWVQPFIDFACPLFSNGVNDEYFLKDQKGRSAVSAWFEGSLSGGIDVTSPRAVEWWQERLEGLRSSYGFDSFKFDAGEVNWLPHSVSLEGEPDLWPNFYTTKYVGAVSIFGGMAEVRVGRMTQEYPIFTRIMDRDSHWGHNAGLKSVIPTVLLFGILGYPFALPDMIGGTGFNPGYPTKELFLRWLELNIFMPSVQFSVVPWDDHFDAETIQITKDLLSIREKYHNEILSAANQSLVDGSPINRPLWWVDPTDPITFTLEQEFMLGDNILVAPVVEEGATSRDIYLPIGTWRSAVTNLTHTGPIWLRNYSAPLNILPYFLRQPE